MKNIKNKNLKLFVISESLFVGGFGLLFPILALFINGNLTGGSILTAGIATTIYALIKSFLRIPISRYCDKRKLHKKFMQYGYLGMALVPIGYFFVKTIWQFFLVQTFFAFVAAVGTSGWYHLFSKNIPKGKEGSKWNGIKGYTGISDAVSATLGGILTITLGFRMTFLVASLLSLIATLILFKIKED